MVSPFSLQDFDKSCVLLQAQGILLATKCDDEVW